MTDLRILILVVAVGFGYFIWQNESAKPTSYDRAVQNHCDLMARLGRVC